MATSAEEQLEIILEGANRTIEAVPTGSSEDRALLEGFVEEMTAESVQKGFDNLGVVLDKNIDQLIEHAEFEYIKIKFQELKKVLLLIDIIALLFMISIWTDTNKRLETIGLE